MVSAVPLAEHVDAERQRLRARLMNEGLPDLRHLDYASYLRTSLWKKIKTWVFDRDSQQCVVCRSEKISNRIDDMDVHHRSYDLDVLEGRNDEMLVSLCKRCHKLVEFCEDGAKRTSLIEKDSVYCRIKALHLRIEDSGLELSVSAASKGRKRFLDVAFSGDPAFLEFYNVDDLMMRFIFHVFTNHRESVSLPMPFGRDKLKQKSGAKLFDIASKRTIVAVNSEIRSARIGISENCSLDIRQLLDETISRSKYWQLATTPQAVLPRGLS